MIGKRGEEMREWRAQSSVFPEKPIPILSKRKTQISKLPPQEVIS